MSDSGEYVPTLEGWLKLMFPNSWLEVRERLAANNAAVREAALIEAADMIGNWLDDPLFVESELRLRARTSANLNQTGVTDDPRCRSNRGVPR